MDEEKTEIEKLTDKFTDLAEKFEESKLLKIGRTTKQYVALSGLDTGAIGVVRLDKKLKLIKYLAGSTLAAIVGIAFRLIGG